ncbi:MAG: glycosyltransferase family 2 protein, partial [Kiritimatiellaeota bacterium]|nr:glycosyltransferase family 2 protein [Kiritimatiellota bacterium]
TCSGDATVDLAKRHGFEIHTIQPEHFNHGLTRQVGADLCPQADVLIYMTQDAVLADPQALENLLQSLENQQAAAAYGRQLPPPGTPPTEAFARQHNYPPESRIKTLADISDLGLHTAFCSNSFAAWRKDALDKIGGFPETDFGEDMLAAARLLQNGWHITYCAEAKVVHSHPLSTKEEFIRSRQIGRMHRANPWLEDLFGPTTGAGKKYLSEQVGFLSKNAPGALPSALLSAAAKFSGFSIGKARVSGLDCPAR